MIFGRFWPELATGPDQFQPKPAGFGKDHVFARAGPHAFGREFDDHAGCGGEFGVQVVKCCLTRDGHGQMVQANVGAAVKCGDIAAGVGLPKGEAKGTVGDGADAPITGTAEAARDGPASARRSLRLIASSRVETFRMSRAR